MVLNGPLAYVGSTDVSDGVDNHYWAVKSGSTYVATDSNPNGWVVSFSGSKLSVSAPASATLGINYSAGYATRSTPHKFENQIISYDYTGPVAAFQLQDLPPARPAAGMPAFSWQGSVAGVNTGNGNKTTTLPIVGWTMRGGMAVSCALIHNSQGPNYVTWGAKWTPTYFSYLDNTGGAPNLHWDTGLSYTFQKDASGSYQAPYGIQDKLVSNGGGQFTLTGTDNTKYVFTLVSNDPNSNSYLSSITDEDGNTLTISHNSNTTISQVTDATGRSLVYTYAGGYLSTIKDPLNRVWSFAYGGSAGAGNLWYVTLPPPTAGQNAAVAFGYDTSHNVTAMQSAAGRASTFGYSGNTLIWAKDPAGNTTRFNYNATTTDIVDPNGHALTHTYTVGNLSRVTDALGNYTGFGYDYNKILSSQKDKRGYSSSFQSHFSDTSGGSSTTSTSTDALGFVSTSVYNAQNKVTSSTDPMGNVSSSTYSTDGKNDLLTTSVTGAGRTPFHGSSSVSGYSNGLPSTLKDAYGNATTLGYDSNGYPTSTRDASGHTGSAVFNALGWKMSSTDGLNHTTYYTYDNWGRVTDIQAPDNTHTQTTYDLDGNVLTVTDADNHTVTNQYDSDGRLTKTTNGRGDVVKYVYDGPDGYGSGGYDGQPQYGLLSSKTDGNGHRTLYCYTALNQPALTVYPDSTSESVTYDANGNSVTRTKADGVVIRYTYDADNRLTDITYPHLHATHFDYDKDGRKTHMSDATGDTTWDYTYYGLYLTAQTTPQGTVYYDYDQNGRRTVRQLVGTGSWNYTYFPNGDLKTVQIPSGETTTYSYDGADRLARRINGDGTYQNIGYDAASQKTDLWYYTSGNSLQGHLAYAHTPAGQISSLTQNGTVTASYAYDGANQLTAETHSGDGAGYNYSHGFTYDANGNRLTQTTNGQPYQSFTYDAHDKMISGTAGSERPGYDQNGNQTSLSIYGAGYTNTYDDEDRLVRLTSTTGIVNTFAYNGLGLRVAKSDSTGSYSYVCDGTSPGSPVLSDGHTVFTAGLSSTINNLTSFRHEDALGSLRFLTDVGQNVLGSSVYEAFGTAVGATGSTAGAPFGWVGGADCQTEADTGLVLMGHRYYDSRVGRFISQDTAKAGTNWYNYCNNDPINNLDPLGLVCAPFDSTGMSYSQIYDHVLANGGLPGESYANKQGNTVLFQFTITSSDFTHIIPGFNVSQNFMQAKRFANTPIVKIEFGHLSRSLPDKGMKIAYLIEMTHTGSHGDPKHLVKGPTGSPMYFYYDRIGQYGFGAIVAGLGLDLQTGLEGAGFAQTLMSMRSYPLYSGNMQQNGAIGFGPPYGDDPSSQVLIRQGFNDYANR